MKKSSHAPTRGDTASLRASVPVPKALSSTAVPSSPKLLRAPNTTTSTGTGSPSRTPTFATTLTTTTSAIVSRLPVAPPLLSRGGAGGGGGGNGGVGGGGTMRGPRHVPPPPEVEVNVLAEQWKAIQAKKWMKPREVSSNLEQILALVQPKRENLTAESVLETVQYWKQQGYTEEQKLKDCGASVLLQMVEILAAKVEEQAEEL
eukprot:RCo014630